MIFVVFNSELYYTISLHRPMYGYHEKEQQFLKIYFYNPNIVRR